MLEFRWHFIGSRAECVGLNIQAVAEDLEPLTTSTLRRLRLSELVTEARDHLNEILIEEHGGQGLPVVQAGPAQMRPATERRLKRVAEVYSAAWRAGHPPVKAVAKRLKVTDAAATKLVFRARSAGFLPPASPGVPTG